MEDKMKKKLAVSIIALMLFGGLQGCSSSNCNRFESHSSIWKNWHHAYFSYFGYKNPNPEDVKRSVEEGWWGCPIYVDEQGHPVYAGEYK
jgi:hypothetical protein